MLSNLFLDLVVGVPWVAGGAFTAKKAIARAERHYLQIAEQHGRPQNAMDGDDWMGAITFAVAAGIAFPAVALVWLLSFPAKWAFAPTREYMLPPVQRTFEGHVADLNAQKALVMSSVKTYSDVRSWEPDDNPDRVAMLHQLEKQIEDQMRQLMRMHNPDNPTGWDGDFLSSTKDEVRAITAKVSF